MPIGLCHTAGNQISSVGISALSQAVAANESLTTVRLHRAPGPSEQQFPRSAQMRSSSVVEQKSVEAISRCCARNKLTRKSQKDLCRRLQLLAWATAVRSACPPNPAFVDVPWCMSDCCRARLLVQAQHMSGQRDLPWDLIESVGQELRSVGATVYTRWVTQRDTERRGGHRLCTAQNSVARGLRANNLAPTAMTSSIGDVGGAGSSSNSSSSARLPHNLTGRVGLASTLGVGASAHGGGYFSPRPPPISSHRSGGGGMSNSSRRRHVPQRGGGGGARYRAALTSWEGRQARRQAQRAELRRIFPHLPPTPRVHAQQLTVRGDILPLLS